MVWMAIGPYGLIGPIRINGSLTGKAYTTLLESVADKLSLRAFDDWATCHSTNAPLLFLQNKGIEHVRYSERIPAKLIEVNVQEQVWSCVQRLVYDGNPCFANANALWSRIVFICDQLRANGQDVKWYRALVATIPKRLRLVCKQNGKQIDLNHL
jgi:hypothetical protein